MNLPALLNPYRPSGNEAPLQFIEWTASVVMVSSSFNELADRRSTGLVRAALRDTPVGLGPPIHHLTRQSQEEMP